jgi:hypothetical protein
MKNKKAENKYWENEEGETVEFGNSFMRCYDNAGKLQFGSKFFDSKTGEKKYIIKFVLDRKELFESNEGVSYLRGTLDDWEESFEGRRDA